MCQRDLITIILDQIGKMIDNNDEYKFEFRMSGCT